MSNIIHYGGIEVRVNGSGNLRPTFYGFDDVISSVLVPLVMTATPGRELFRLANFRGQRAKLRIETTAIEERFKINRITIYTKPIYTGYVG